MRINNATAYDANVVLYATRSRRDFIVAEVFANNEEIIMTNSEDQFLRDGIAELIKLFHTSAITDEWMSTKEAGAYTKLSVRTINRAVSNGEVQVSQQVGKNLFRRSWLDQWLGVKDIHTNRKN